MTEVLLDAAGRRRSPATMPGFHAGRSPRNKGQRSPADPPTVQEIVAVMRHSGDGQHGTRLHGLTVVLWGRRPAHPRGPRAQRGRSRSATRIARGKGGRRREVGMDEWRWEQLRPWMLARVELPVGPLFCVATGPTRGRGLSPAAGRAQLRHAAVLAGVRRRFAPHQLRHAHAVEMHAKASR
jgi:integrase